MRSRGPLDAVTGVVGGAAAGLRRRREARRPYVKLYAATGDVRTLEVGDGPGEVMLETANAMVEITTPPARSGRPERG
jgi:hypothetical protein